MKTHALTTFGCHRNTSNLNVLFLHSLPPAERHASATIVTVIGRHAPPPAPPRPRPPAPKLDEHHEVLAYPLVLELRQGLQLELELRRELLSAAGFLSDHRLELRTHVSRAPSANALTRP